MRFAVSDSKGIATVENDAGGSGGRAGPGSGEIRVRLDATVQFGRDSAAITDVADDRLTEVAEQLRARGPGAPTATGYTDDLGSAGHGLVLGRRRVAAVAGFLRRTLAEDVPVRVVGRGEDGPEVPNDSEAHRRLNRRVMVVYRPR